jgi:hypothetical protein
MKLTFGKFKGMLLSDTPQWYQDWLKQQDWFVKKFLNNPQYDERAQIKRDLSNWNGYGRKGQAAYERAFELECKEQDDYDRRTGAYEPDGIFWDL